MYDYLVEVVNETAALTAVAGTTEIVELIVGSTTVTENKDVVSTLEVLTAGPPGPPGPPGSAGYTHHQTTAAATWLIAHNLNKKPDIALFIDADLTERVWTDVSYVDSNTLTVVWPSAVSGWAYI